MKKDSISIAWLATHMNDLEYLQDKEGDLIAHDKFLFTLTPENTFSGYFYPKSTGDSKEHQEIHYMAQDWFRDSDGVDQVEIEGFSAPLILTAWTSALYIAFYKNLNALKIQFEKYDIIHASINEHESFKLAASYFKSKIKWYDPNHVNTYQEASIPKRIYKIIKYPNSHRLSSFARILQYPFRSLMKKSFHFNLADWTTEGIGKRSDTLTQNNKSILKGYYFKKKKVFVSEGEAIFPSTLPDEYISKEKLVNSLKRIGTEWEDPYLDGYIKIFKSTYYTWRNNLIHSYSLYCDVFNKYQPKLLSIPGEALHCYVIAAQLARKMEIKTLLMVDGYQCTWIPHIFYKDKTNTKNIFDYVCGYGQLGVDQMKSCSFTEDQILKIRPPLLSHLDLQSFNPVPNSVMVMFTYPRDDNPSSRWDFKRELAQETIELALETGASLVALKMKPGRPNQTDEDVEFMTNIFAKEIETGKVVIELESLASCVGKYEKMIAPLSSAIAEALYMKLECYLFDPVENGISDKEIEMSWTGKPGQCARTIDELRDNLKNGNHLEGCHEYLFSGQSIEDFDFSSLI